MTFSVNPADLQEGSRLTAGAVGDLDGLPGEVARLLCAVGDAAGASDVASASRTAARRWSPATEALTREARSLARGVGHAGSEYTATEGATNRQFGAGG